MKKSSPRTLRGLRGLLRDDRGMSTTGTLGFSLTWFVIFFVFMMNVQLGQLFHRRDVVDHAAALAADSAQKSYCAKSENRSAAEQEALKATMPILQTASNQPQQDCKVSIRPGGEGGSSDPGAKPLEVSLECSFDCKIPIAAQVMCKQGKASFASKLKTVALGCDGQGT
jgi:hypothetical protein